MKKFTVAIGFAKQANIALINSNKLKNSFYNIGNKFLCNESDFSTIREILDRKMIKIQA